MAPLPVVSGRDLVRTFASLGWRIARQSGSHIIMVKEGHVATLSIPDHKEVARGTLRSLVRAAEVTSGEFLKVLKDLG